MICDNYNVSICFMSSIECFCLDLMQLKFASPANSVFFGCNDTFVSVAVKVDPLGTSRRLNPAYLTLGKCPVSSTTALLGYLVFEYQYSACRFDRMALGNAVKLYANLVYMPTQMANQYSEPFSVPIVCIAKRSMNPTPIDMTSTVFLTASGMGNLNFSFRFMNDDFSGPSDAKDFLLGSPINLELSVNLGYHIPLRLLVDEGIVTPTTDIALTPRYDLINNHGCFVDGKVAHSRFVKQDPINTIWLTFPAMKFVTLGNEIYLTFKLVVWDPKDVTELRKACSYLLDTNRWELLGSADNTVCTCCDNVCSRSSRKKRNVNENEDGLVHTMVLGPFKVHSPSTNGNESRAAETVSVTGFLMPPAVGALLLELAVLLLLCIGVILYGRSKQKRKEIEERSLVTNEH
ncbi:PREDICTED: zona pellucida sperm-binding protein 3-like [Nanorana parkeri]|uniref:zona pellucida sperm-binding protein 3-like n=1 Tax=Nanorana parkeri TaxID=125878 RepID=UPI00085453F6|nr:PREDICTED: zona pellucida sperm-binding protein 3-like [Nanorana parkeri]